MKGDGKKNSICTQHSLFSFLWAAAVGCWQKEAWCAELCCCRNPPWTGLAPVPRARPAHHPSHPFPRWGRNPVLVVFTMEPRQQSCSFCSEKGIFRLLAWSPESFVFWAGRASKQWLSTLILPLKMHSGASQSSLRLRSRLPTMLDMQDLLWDAILSHWQSVI